MALAAGATPDRISFGNTIKKERDIARAFALGVACSPSTARPRSRRSRAPRPAPRCSAASSATATAPNGRCRASSAARPTMAPDVLEHAHRSASRPMACRSTSARSSATRKPGTARCALGGGVFRECAERGIDLTMVNLGGGFPARYLKHVPAVESLRRGDLPGAVASTSATASRRRSSSRAAAWSATPA